MNFSKSVYNRFIAQLQSDMIVSCTYGLFKLFNENIKILLYESD